MQYGLGYLPELTDIRDFTVSDVKEELPATLKFDPKAVSELPKKVDNSRYCSPVHDQGSQGSCTGQSAVSLFEYMEKRAGGRHVDGSRSFVYFNSRLHAKLNTNNDTGSYIRSTIKAVIMDGIAEESKFPYNQKDWKTKPSEEIYRNALNFKGVKYVRLDDGNGNLVEKIKTFINQGYAVNFGFSVYQCIDDVTAKVPVLPFPSKGEKQLGGHAVIAVGYDDNAPSKNKRDGNTTTGGFYCQNSWSTAWGNKGFFYIPYKYFEAGLALDVWTITSIDYVDTKAFD